MPSEKTPKRYGSMVQVWRGNAEMTDGGLTKKDIIPVKTSEGTIRYKSKKRQQKVNRKSSSQNKRALALKKAREELIKEGILPKDAGFVPAGGKTKYGKALKKRIDEILA